MINQNPFIVRNSLWIAGGGFPSGSVVSTGSIYTVVEAQEISGVASTMPIDSFSDTSSFASKWFISVVSGSNRRMSEVMATWDNVSNDVGYTEISTVDVGNTNGINFSVDVDGIDNVRLVANVTFGSWKVRTTRLLM